MAPEASSKPADSTATIGFEAKLWLAADKLRNNTDAAESERSGDSQPQAARRASEARQYKHVVLGLIFLKYISDTAGKFRMPNGEIRTRKARLIRQSEFVIRHLPPPADARWSNLQANAKQPTISKTVDDAMGTIERDNPRLKGILPKDYARPGLDTARRDSALSTREAKPQSLSAAKDNHRLGELIDLIATISPTAAGEGEKTHRSVDLLGRMYDWSGATKIAAGSPKGERGGAHQYFLTRFASAEGKNGGVAKCEVRSASVEVKTLRPFVIRNSSFDISRADIGKEHADTFLNFHHPDLVTT